MVGAAVALFAIAVVLDEPRERESASEAAPSRW